MTTALLLMVAFLGCSGANASVDSSVVDEMAEAYRRLETLEADLTQIDSYPQLGLTDPPQQGVLQVEKRGPGINVRLEMTTPEHRVLVVQEGTYTFYQPRIKQAIVGNAGVGKTSRAGFLKYLLGDVSEVETEFLVEVLDEEETVGRRPTTHLRLRPRKGTESPYVRIELWVDDELGIPIQEKLVEPNGDEVLIRLERVRLNGPAGRFEFELDLPADVERIRG